jgi:hypothetical protein
VGDRIGRREQRDGATELPKSPAMLVTTGSRIRPDIALAKPHSDIINRNTSLYLVKPRKKRRAVHAAWY